MDRIAWILTQWYVHLAHVHIYNGFFLFFLKQHKILGRMIIDLINILI